LNWDFHFQLFAPSAPPRGDWLTEFRGEFYFQKDFHGCRDEPVVLRPLASARPGAAEASPMLSGVAGLVSMLKCNAPPVKKTNDSELLGVNRGRWQLEILQPGSASYAE
jgi:hypothetical protein